MQTYKLTLQHVDGDSFQQCYDQASGDLHQAFVLLADKVLLPNHADPLAPTANDRIICHHLSEICRTQSCSAQVVSGTVYLTGPSEELQPLEAEGHLEIQP